MYTINNNKGIALIIAFFVIIVLSITGLAFFTSSVQEKIHAEIEIATISAKYQADRGLAYIITELRKHGSNWVTHTVDTETLALKKAKPAPSVSLPNCKIDKADGAYVPISGNREFAIKVFTDPSISAGNERMILVKGTVKVKVKGTEHSITRLFAAKVSNLYEYFIFTPYSWNFSSGEYNAKWNNIYVGGNITFYGSTRINELSLLMTPEYINYNRYFYVPPEDYHDLLPTGYNSWAEVYYDRRTPYWTPNPCTAETCAPDNYINHYDGRVRGELTGLKMEDLLYGEPDHPDQYIAWDGSIAHPYIEPDDIPEIYVNTNSLSWINGIPLPNRLDSNVYPGAGWAWNKYHHTSDNYSYPADEITTYHLNTAEQPSYLFTDFLESQGEGQSGLRLDEVIKEKNTDGKPTTALTINADRYLSDAQNCGIHITTEEDNLVMYINGTPYVADKKGNIKIRGKLLLSKRDFYDANSTQLKETVQLDIAQMNKIGNLAIPQNGIIFSDGNIVISNATQLPNGGLTVLCKEHIYAHGSFNTIDWQPAAFIPAKRFYALSRDFDFPDKLPSLYRHPNWEYVSQQDRDDWAAAHASTMTNLVEHNEEYNVSLVGYVGHSPYVLERWPDSVTRTITGAFIRLESDCFHWTEYPTASPFWQYFDNRRTRWCEDGFPSRECRDLVDGKRQGSTYATYAPSGANNIRAYETEYANQGVFPPGGPEKLSVQVEINNTEANFNQVYLALCARELLK